MLEAWDRLEASGEMPVGGSQLASESEQLSVPSKKEKGESEQLPVIREQEPDREVVEEAVQAEDVHPQAAEKPLQPTLIDFSVYRCLKCDKMVMGFDREGHMREVHGGRGVEWRRVK